jgi:hypothetical protein
VVGCDGKREDGVELSDALLILTGRGGAVSDRDSGASISTATMHVYYIQCRVRFIIIRYVQLCILISPIDHRVLSA